MRFHTDAAAGVITGGSFSLQLAADVFYDGVRTIRDAPVVGWQFTGDYDAKIKTAGSVKIAYQGALADSISPRELTDTLAPFGQEVRPYAIVSSGVFTERIPLGVYRIDDTPTADDVQSIFQGRVITHGSVVELSLLDRFHMLDVPSMRPVSPVSLTSAWAEIARLSQLQVTRTVPDAVIPRSIVYARNRLEAVQQLAAVLGGRAMMLSDGTLGVVSDVPGDVDVLLRIGDGAGTIIDVSGGMSAGDLANAVYGDFEDDLGRPIHVESSIVDGPLRVDGPFGERPMEYPADQKEFIRTWSAAQTAVRNELARVSTRGAREIDVQVVPDPRIEVGDVVSLQRLDETVTGRVVKYSFGMDAATALTVRVFESVRRTLAAVYTAWAEQARNLFTNPSFESTSGTVEVRRNPVVNPAPSTAGTDIFVTHAGAIYLGVTTEGFRWRNDNPGTNAIRLGDAYRVAVTPGETWSAGLIIQASNSNSTSEIVQLLFRAYAGAVGSPMGAAMSTIASAVLTLAPGQTRAFTAENLGIPAGALSVTVIPATSSAATVGNEFVVRQVQVEKGMTLGPYFDGTTSPDPDLTPSWTGAAKASASILTGAIPAGTINVTNAFVYQSSGWSSDGPHSVRVTPRTSSTDTFTPIGGDTGGFRLGMQAGETYTILATVRLDAAQTGPLNPLARSIRPLYRTAAGGYVSVPSTQPPNLPGEYSLEMTFTIPADATEAFVRLMNGSAVGGGDVWWDSVAVVEGVYDGPPFTGGTERGLLRRTRWLGTPDASVSVLETRDLVGYA